MFAPLFRHVHATLPTNKNAIINDLQYHLQFTNWSLNFTCTGISAACFSKAVWESQGVSIIERLTFDVASMHAAGYLFTRPHPRVLDAALCIAVRPSVRLSGKLKTEQSICVHMRICRSYASVRNLCIHVKTHRPRTDRLQTCGDKDVTVLPIYSRHVQFLQFAEPRGTARNVNTCVRIGYSSDTRGSLPYTVPYSTRAVWTGL